MRRTGCAAVLILMALACAAPAARAGMRLEAWRGHLALGFAQVVSDSLAPGGSLSAGAGVDYPLGGRWRVGPALHYNLLGTSEVSRGSIHASLDYSLFEAALLFTYLPARGPVARWSFGPGVASPRAELVIAGGGAGFTDLTVSEIKPELALDATLMSRRMPVVAIGGELGVRYVPTSQGAWTTITGRLAIHY